ncbi:MAG: WG repeat-containing protein [Tidjanibacter sp.]|nr:WG repeat-containing protein [Tidjanibacter sp.]
MKRVKIICGLVAVLLCTSYAAAQPSRVKGKNELYGFVDNQNNTVVSCQYTDAGLFFESRARVSKNGKWGFIDEKGTIVVAMRYDEACDFVDGWAAVRSGASWAYINSIGLPMKSDYIRSVGTDFSSSIEAALDFSEGLAAICVDGKWGFVDQKGKTVIEPQYSDVNSFNDGAAAVVKGGKMGYIDRYNNVVIPIKYSGAGYFSLDGAVVRDPESGLCGFISPDGLKLSAFRYNDCFPYKGGYAAVSVEGRWGFIDAVGRTAVKPHYDWVDWKVEEGMAVVSANNKYGVIDLSDNTMLPIEYDYLTACQFRRDATNAKLLANYPQVGFTLFARNYVTKVINEWQKKDQFESSDEFRARVNPETRQAKVAELTEEARQRYIEKLTAGFTFRPELGDYDADNEVFLINEKHYGQMLLSVPRKEARSFSAEWKMVKVVDPVYYIDNNAIMLAELSFATPEGKRYTYSNSASLNYAVADIDYRFDPIELPEIETGIQKGTQTVSQSTIKVGKSDVDLNIPKTDLQSSRTFAVIIANEDYQSEQRVPYALNDGNSFSQYCQSTLGIPIKNIRFVKNATLNNIRSQINWVGEVARSFDGQADVIFYYAGHGIPDESNGTSYLLPVDGVGTDPATGYKVDELFATLGAMPAARVTVFMDACFSGSKRDGGMLASARGVAIKVRQGQPEGNMVVFCASQNDETAFPFNEKGHGLFTYYLLKKLQQDGGNVSLGELGRYVQTNVKQQSILVNSKSQTPSVTAASALGNDWQQWTLVR